MNLYNKYLAEIKKRKSEGLGAKPIESGKLLKEIINLIKAEEGPDRKSCLDYLVYNTLPGTTSAAKEKANILKEIIIGDFFIKEITFVISSQPTSPPIEITITRDITTPEITTSLRERGRRSAD